MPAGRPNTTDTAALPQDDQSVYISSRELAERWRCSRASVQRVCQRAGLKKLLLGHGRNGMVRYLTTEILELETRQTI
jgi:hypothetical protein